MMYRGLGYGSSDAKCCARTSCYEVYETEEHANKRFQPEISRATITTLKGGIDSALTAALAAFPSCGSLISISL